MNTMDMASESEKVYLEAYNKTMKQKDQEI